MSRMALGAALMIAVLSMTAVAGWVVDGEREAAEDGELAAQVEANTGAIVSLSTGKVDKGASSVMPMDDAAGTNSRWTEWAVGGQGGTNGNWRIGVMSSNFVVQVRESGGWSNVVVFLKQ